MLFRRDQRSAYRSQRWWHVSRALDKKWRTRLIHLQRPAAASFRLQQQHHFPPRQHRQQLIRARTTPSTIMVCRTWAATRWTISTTRNCGWTSGMALRSAMSPRDWTRRCCYRVAIVMNGRLLSISSSRWRYVLNNF